MKQETGKTEEILHVLNQHNVTHGINQRSYAVF